MVEKVDYEELLGDPVPFNGKVDNNITHSKAARLITFPYFMLRDYIAMVPKNEHPSIWAEIDRAAKEYFATGDPLNPVEYHHYIQIKAIE